jgi:hypothetical protein
VDVSGVSLSAGAGIWLGTTGNKRRAALGIVGLVWRMLDLHKKLAAATIPADKELCQRQINATTRRSTRWCMSCMD